MDKLFLTVLNMSLTGAFVIAVICVARLPLKKAPKIISYCLWAVVGFRLVFPFSIESVFSLIPFKAQTIPPDIAMQPIPRIDSGIPFVNNAVSSVLPAATPAASINPLQIWTAIGASVWIFGVAVMVIYGVVSFFILNRKMSEAAHTEANIYETKNIKSPFVLGVFNPRIFLPIGLSEQEKSYIILHEKTHIKRRDHIVKFAAYFILCLHWFNPLAWVAFLLMGVDMEMSCDERVLKEMGGETKTDYSLSLLSLATERRIIGGSPLAFGEGGVKERIKNVLNFRKPSRVIIVAAVALVAVLSVGFAVNRMSGHEPLTLGTYITDDGLTQTVFHGDNEFYIVRRGISYSPTGTWVYETEPNDNKVILICSDDERYVFSYQANRLTFEWGTWLENWIEPGTVFTLSEELLRQNILQQYILENATDRERFERMMYVILYSDGTARLATPPISSYMLPDCTYVLADGELLIYASIKTNKSENAFGVKNGEVIARFMVADDNTLVFKESSVPLFADEGARYVSAPLTTPEKTPLLDVNLVTVDVYGSSQTQISRDVRAAQLTNDWYVEDENGDGFGYSADSFHPLQKQDGYGDVTLNLNNSGIITLLFSDSYPPLSVSVRRWNAEFAGTDSTDIWGKGEPVNVMGNTFQVSDDGNDYIYEVYAKWREGDSWYVFRIDSTNSEPQSTMQPGYASLLSSWEPLAELPVDYSKNQAIDDNVFVSVHGAEVYNQNVVDFFYKNAFAGVAAFMRVMQYTIEGDVIITDYQFDGEIFTVTHDSTRDKFSAPEDRIISTATYKYLVPPNGSHPTISPQNYYLSNEQNIIEGTSVWWAPPPSQR